MKDLLEDLQEVLEMYQSDLEIVKQDETKKYIANCIIDTQELIEKYKNR